MQATGVPTVSSNEGQIKRMQFAMVITTPVVNVQVSHLCGIAQSTTAPISSVGASAAATAGAAPVVSGLASTASSKGSQLHGQITVDGQPACQPCAWFHKASGCQNGVNCRRCHSCPESEVKLRKKQKVARLRYAEAAGVPVGNAPISLACEFAADASAAAWAATWAKMGLPEQGHEKIISPRH